MEIAKGDSESDLLYPYSSKRQPLVKEKEIYITKEDKLLKKTIYIGNFDFQRNESFQ